MANIYQAVLDEASEKRRRLLDRGYEPSQKLVEKARTYLREREERGVMERLGQTKGERESCKKM